MIWIEIEPGASILLTAENEPEVKAFLYSKFTGSKELILRDEDEKEIDKLRLEDLF